MKYYLNTLFLTGAIVLLSATVSGASSADEEIRVFSVQIENDFFGGGTDRHFTHGTRLIYLTKPKPWITKAVGWVPWFELEREGVLKDSHESLQARASLSVGQNIYTPEDISDPDLIINDRPYAGWLYFGFGLVANQGSSRYDKVELAVGVVGPLSFAEEIHERWHSAFGLQNPEGWDHQLENELGVTLFYEQARRFGRNNLPYNLQFDLIPHFGGSVGNVFTYFSTGFTARLGSDLKSDFGPPRVRPSLPGGGYLRSEKGRNWYLFAGLDGRVVLRNIFLDGNTFSGSHSVKKKRCVGDMQVGLTIQFNRFHVTYTQIFSSIEYVRQENTDSFGSLMISHHF